MKIVLQYRASEGFRSQIGEDVAHPVAIVDETDEAAFAREMADAEVLWHVLEPVTARVMDGAPRLKLIQKLGVGVTVFVTFRAHEHTDEWLKSLVDAVQPMPEVMELYRLSGERDYLLKVKVADIPAYDRLYKRLMRAVRLSDVSSSFAMEKLKHTTAIPLPGRD